MKIFQNRLNQWLLPILLITIGLLILLFYYLIPEYANSITALIIETATPLFIVFAFYRMDRYRILELRWLIFCLLGGSLAYFIEASIFKTLMSHGVLSLEAIVMFAGPILGTIITGSTLYIILSRVKFARIVDGIIYGVAVGAGFTIFENYEHQEINIAIARALSTNLMLMAVAGISGFLLATARFDKNKAIRIVKILAALTLPSIINSIYNILVSSSEAALLIAMTFGISSITILGVVIRHLVNQDEKWIEQFLQDGSVVHGNSPINNVQQITKSIRNLFGTVRASQMERFLILQARRGILQKSLQNMDDPKLRRPIEEQMDAVQKKIRGSRSAIGTYCWENIKALIPEIDFIGNRVMIGECLSTKS